MRQNIWLQTDDKTGSGNRRITLVCEKVDIIISISCDNGVDQCAVSHCNLDDVCRATVRSYGDCACSEARFNMAVKKHQKQIPNLR